MNAGWWLWLATAFLGAVLIELCRANLLLARNITNEPSLDRYGDRDLGTEAPLVSVIVPARDEEMCVEACVRSILGSDYRNIEIIVVDDRSTDRTAEIVASLVKEDPRVRMVSVTELPHGWTGKTHALYRGAAQAHGDLLLFSDADTWFHPRLLSTALTCFWAEGLDMLGLLPGFLEKGFVEKALHPHLEINISYFFPLSDINDRTKATALASGSFLLMRRITYQELGTWEAFRTNITEDVALSRAVKAIGRKLLVMRAEHMLQTRGFGTVSAMCAFWKRTYYGAFDKNLALHARCTVQALVLTLLPVAALGAGYALMSDMGTIPMQAIFGLSLCALLGVMVPFTIFIRTEGVHWAYGLTAPLGLAVACWVAAGTLVTTLRDTGIHWRGTVYR